MDNIFTCSINKFFLTFSNNLGHQNLLINGKQKITIRMFLVKVNG